MKSIRDISLASNEAQAVAEAVTLLKQQFPVTGVRLFGSKARGDADLESDIDLLVLTSRRLSWHERDAMTDALYDIH